MKRLIALTLGLAAASALAQTPRSSANPDAGFFRPNDLAVPRVSAQAQPAAPDSAEEIRKAEEARRIDQRTAERIEAQMDRIERENERARDQPVATINGAFSGLTDERNR
jgi:hypothetical protein